MLNKKIIRPSVATTETDTSSHNQVSAGLEAQADYISSQDGLQGRLVVRPKEAAKLIGVGNNKIYELCRRQDFPSIKVGQNYIIPVDALQRWLTRQAEQGA